MKTFYCEHCKETFNLDEDFTEKDKKEEYESNFKRDLDISEAASVCDVCYNKMMTIKQ